MKILFIGSTRRGFLTLQALLHQGARVVGIVSLTQDDHEADRFEGPIRDLASLHGVPVKETKFVRDGSLSRWAVEERQAEVAIAVGVRILLPQEFHKAFSLGCWGVHDSLLPEYRGFAPLNWSLINDEVQTGVTLFQISDRMDGGDILLQQSVPIGPTESAPEVYQRVCDATVSVVIEGCRQLSEQRAESIAQDYSTGSFTCARSPADGQIDWTQSSRSIFNLIRALTFPYPGAYTHYRGRRVWIVAAEEVLNPPRYVGRIPGKVVRILASGGVEVLTGDGILRLTCISTDGRRPCQANEVIRSVKARLGLTVIDLEERLANLEQRIEALTAHATR